MNDGDNPMCRAHAAPRCAATSKRTGQPCKGPAVKGWRVCRFHGAGGGHRAGADHPSYRHGMRAREWIEARREINDLVRETREIERALGGGDGGWLKVRDIV
ncbi:hypothetical protein ACSSVY_001643 [Roseovarius sp. MBR-51]